MTERTMADRVILHEDIGTMEADFTASDLRDEADVDAFYDEADRRLAATGKRWYFLVIYTDCVIRPEVWDRFAARGKHTNVTYGLGTVRVGTSAHCARDDPRARAARACSAPTSTSPAIRRCSRSARCASGTSCWANRAVDAAPTGARADPASRRHPALASAASGRSRTSASASTAARSRRSSARTAPARARC